MVGFQTTKPTCSLVSTMLCVLCLVLGPLWTVAASSLPFSSAVSDKQVLSRADSPYFIDRDVIVTETGSLTIEAGVVLKFRPSVGITVRGALTAKVNYSNFYQIQLFVDRNKGILFKLTQRCDVVVGGRRDKLIR